METCLAPGSTLAQPWLGDMRHEPVDTALFLLIAFQNITA